MSDDSNDYREKAKDEVTHWEATEPRFIARIGDAILWPAQKAAEFLVPEAVQDAVANAIEGFLGGLDCAARNTIDVDEIRSRLAQLQLTLKDDLKSADDAAMHYWNWHVGYAAAEGGLTGATGLMGLAADIPALFGIALRLIQQVGVCYGYDVHSENEREYVLHILRTGSTGDLKAKVEFLIGLKQIEQILLKVAWKKMNEALAQREISRLAALAALRQFAKSLGIQVTKRKALQMIPVVGAVVGASFNATFVNDVGRAAYMSYRRRWIAEREGGDAGETELTAGETSIRDLVREVYAGNIVSERVERNGPDAVLIAELQNEKLRELKINLSGLARKHEQEGLSLPVIKMGLRFD